MLRSHGILVSALFAIVLSFGSLFPRDGSNAIAAGLDVPCATPGIPVPESPPCGGHVPAGDVVVTWTAATDATSYDYEGYITPNCIGGPVVSGNTAGTSFTWPNVPSYVTYSWRVRARNSDNPSPCSPEAVGDWSDCCSFVADEILCTTPGTPTPMTPACGSEVTPGTVTLAWGAASDASSYDYQGYSGADCTGTLLISGNTTDTSVAWNDVPENVSYGWRVRARNDSYPEGCTREAVGPWSDCCSFGTGCTRTLTVRYPLWEWVTVGVTPSSLSASSVFGSLLPNLAIAKDDEGHVYIPGIVDNLSPVDILNGYQVFLKTRADTLVITGSLPDVGQDCVPISPGRWNLIPYLTDGCDPGCGDDVTTAMVSIADCVSIVKDNDGHVWIPALHINTIGRMDPLRAYYLFPAAGCTDPQTLCYPSCTPPLSKAQARHDAAPGAGEQAEAGFYPVVPTGLPDAVVVLEASDLGRGDEVGLFSEGRPVGAAVYNGECPFVIPVWREDRDEGLPGFVPGGPMTARAWSPRSGREVDLAVTAAGGSPASFLFRPYATVILGRRDLHGPCGILGILPNPMRQQVEIRYRVGATANVRLSLFDVGGRLVREFLEGPRASGEYALTWDGRDGSGRRVESGTYFAKISPGSGLRRLLVIR